jgi:hypothetical protein
MTLKDKLIDAFKSGKRFDIKNAEVIADEFAIGFAEWILKFDNLKNENKYIIEQLLEIYKKEKGLYSNFTTL